MTIKEVKTVPNMSANNNPRTLPINLYTVGPPKVQPLDLTKLGDVPLKHSPQKDSTRALMFTSRVCITVSNSPNPSRVYIRLCKHGKRFLLLKWSASCVSWHPTRIIKMFENLSGKTSSFFRKKFKVRITHSLVLKQHKSQMMNPSKHDNPSRSSRRRRRRFAEEYLYYD